MNPRLPLLPRSGSSSEARQVASRLRAQDDGIEVRHDVEHRFLLHDPSPGLGGNFMAGLDGEIAVHFEVDLDPDHVTHLARLEAMDAQYTGRFQQQDADAGFGVRINAAVHEIVESIVEEAPAHTRDHQAYY